MRYWDVAMNCMTIITNSGSTMKKKHQGMENQH